MKNLLKTICLLFTLSVLISACTDNEVYGNDYTLSLHYLKLNTDRLTFNKKGGEQSIQVTTDHTFDVAVSGDSWLTAEINGNAVSVSADVNDTGKTRTCKIVISMSDGKSGSVRREVEVSQLAASDITVDGFDDEESLDPIDETQGNIGGEPFGDDKNWD